jgi:hypothetical protein
LLLSKDLSSRSPAGFYAKTALKDSFRRKAGFLHRFNKSVATKSGDG